MDRPIDPFTPDFALSSSSGTSLTGMPLYDAPALDARGPVINGPPTAPASVASSLSSTNGDGRGPPVPPTTPAACLACRSKHLKCDGLSPCTRCRTSEHVCRYVASRRGYKGPRRGTAARTNKRHASASPPRDGGDGGSSCPMLLGATVPAPNMAPFNPAGLHAADAGASYGYPVPDTRHTGMRAYGAGMGDTSERMDGLDTADTVNTVVAVPQRQPLPERCIDAYYSDFFPGHPTVLPKEHLFRLARTRDLGHLLSAMRWTGSLYLDVGRATRDALLDEALRLAYAPGVVRDGFLIQTLAILLVGLDGNCERDRSREMLGELERVALDTGIYKRDYAARHAGGSAVLAESWRRTWWDLFVVDGMYAGVHRTTGFLLFDIVTGVADAGLPCEEHEYLSGNVPPPMYLEELEDGLFSGEDRPFSSFAFRISSIRNLGRMMRTRPDSLFPGADGVDKIEALLSNWRLHLPTAKRDCLDKDCQPDEMMFQGWMINSACTIMLHQPHSQLDASATRELTACAPHQMVRSDGTFNAHTRHIVAAAAAISRMVTFAVPVRSHTHFFTCVLTLSSIVHLSKWAHYCVSRDDDDLRQLIRLNAGALSALSAVWGAAAKAAAQVRAVARDIYRAKQALRSSPACWRGFTHDEIVGSYEADQGIMDEIDNTLPADYLG